MAINKSIVQGRLTKDVELRHTQSGKEVASFTVAWSEKHGENENKLFLPCVAWGQTATFVSKWFSKGQELIAEGRLGTRPWTDKDGNKREIVEMTVDKIHFCGPKADGAKPAPAPAADQFSDIPDDDELPFF